MTKTLDPKLDVVFRALFTGPEHPTLLSSLLTAVLRPASPILGVELLDPAISGEMVDDKNIVLDVLVRLEDGHFINVEMHIAIRPGHRRRSLVYWSRAYTSQLSRGQTYDEICPVVGVHFVVSPLLLGDRFHSIFRLLEVTDHEPYSDAIELHVVELSKLPDLGEASTDPLVRWGQFLMAETDEDRSRSVRGDAAMEKAEAELGRLSRDPAVRELAERRELGRKLNQIELAMARKEARREGREEGALRNARNILLKVLSARGLEPSHEAILAIERCRDVDVLERWHLRVVSATSIEDVFDDVGGRDT